MKSREAHLYMDFAVQASKMSYCERKQVGCVIVDSSSKNVIAVGWNGTISGHDNCCEETVNGELVTKDDVLHAEMNALAKVAKSTSSSEGSKVFVTLSPCTNCAKHLIQAGVTELYYKEGYRDNSGCQLLEKSNVKCIQLK